MRVRGLDYSVLHRIADDLDMSLLDVREAGKDLAFKVRNKSSHTYYSRKGLTGRRINAVCFHGWRDFIRVCFVNGATRIKTANGTWANVDVFDKDLPRMAGQNVGSQIDPRTMPDLCTHEGGLPKLLKRAVQAARAVSPSSEAVA